LAKSAQLAFVLIGSLLAWVNPAHGDEARSEQVINSAKTAEQAAGVKPTGNFSSTDARVTAYYRCYYTGKLELPESYDGLKLRQGSKDGCSLDPEKYDVFFYPIEAVASGHSPVTEALATAAPERIATVVPHEDFHSQIEALPDRIAEAAATLIGFVVGAAAIENNDAELFLRKADLINLYYEKLRTTYQAARQHRLSKRAALEEKRSLFAALKTACTSIPEPRSFGKCVSSPNNAGLAFDYTYTKFYPLFYRVFSACKQDSKCTVEAIVNAPKKRSEATVTSYFDEFINSRTL
jgi:hypothetical protein